MSGHEWHASTDPKDKTGTATFRALGHVAVMRLDSFSDFDSLCRLLTAAYANGKLEGANIVANAAQGAYNEIRAKP